VFLKRLDTHEHLKKLTENIMELLLATSEEEVETAGLNLDDWLNICQLFKGKR